MDNVFYEQYRDRDVELLVFEGKSSKTPIHFHRNLEILYVTDGEMLSTVGDERFVAGKDEIVFVHNYYVHSFYPETDYKKYVMIVSADYAADIDKILSKSSLSPHLSDTEFNREKICPILKKLCDEEMPQLVKKGYLNVVMGLLFDFYPSVPIKTSSNIESIVAVLEYIDKHFSEPISLESIASEFGYNKYYFSRFFNRYIGENLTNYINIVRINNFMHLSKKYKSPQISKLAAECGFESMPTFYRSFKKLYGETPKSYFSKK